MMMAKKFSSLEAEDEIREAFRVFDRVIKKKFLTGVRVCPLSSMTLLKVFFLGFLGGLALFFLKYNFSEIFIFAILLLCIF